MCLDGMDYEKKNWRMMMNLESIKNIFSNFRDKQC